MSPVTEAERFVSRDAFTELRLMFEHYNREAQDAATRADGLMRLPARMDRQDRTMALIERALARTEDDAKRLHERQDVAMEILNRGFWGRLRWLVTGA